MCLVVAPWAALGPTSLLQLVVILVVVTCPSPWLLDLVRRQRVVSPGLRLARRQCLRRRVHLLLVAVVHLALLLRLLLLLLLLLGWCPLQLALLALLNRAMGSLGLGLLSMG